MYGACMHALINKVTSARVILVCSISSDRGNPHVVQWACPRFSQVSAKVFWKASRNASTRRQMSWVVAGSSRPRGSFVRWKSWVPPFFTGHTGKKRKLGSKICFVFIVRICSRYIPSGKLTVYSGKSPF